MTSGSTHQGLATGRSTYMPWTGNYKTCSLPKLLLPPFQWSLAAKSVWQHGQKSATGNCTFFDKILEVKQIATVLPRLPADVDIVSIQKQYGPQEARKFATLLVRRQYIADALDWLQANNAGFVFHNITIDRTLLELIPEHEYLSPSVVRHEGDSNVDLGPANQAVERDEAKRDDDEGDRDVIIVEESGVIQDPLIDLASQAGSVNAINTAIGTVPPAPAPPAPAPPTSVPVVAQMGYNSKFLNPFETPYFWSLAFPGVFMPSEKIVTLTDGREMRDCLSELSPLTPRVKKIEFAEWAKTLMHLPQFVSHPTLKFSLVTLKGKKQMEGATRYGVAEVS